MICPALSEALLPDHPALDGYLAVVPACANSPAAATSARADLLRAVRTRIGKGYYNSTDVIDELSDSFARVFNEKS